VFAWLGRAVYRYRFIVVAVMVALCLGGGVFGLSLGKHVTQSGFFDDASQSAKASVLGDEVYGRDRTGHIVAVFTAPDGQTVDDPQWQANIVDQLNSVVADHPNEILGWAGWLRAPTSTDPTVQQMHTADMKRTFVSIPLKGDNDDQILNNYKTVQSDLQQLDGGEVELAGLQPVSNELTGTIDKDQKRMEVLALPLVAVVLFFVFGGVIAAGLPVLVGGLSIAGSLGILRLIAVFGPVHYFAQPVVTMIGLGIAIDYGLFVVSRFREEIADGYDTETAVRRTVMTSGRTVVFSAVIIAASAAPLLLFPQGFLKSLTYAIIAAVLLSATLSVTLLPACLGVLGWHVDALGVRTLLRVPVLRNWKPTNWWLNWLADRLQKTKTREEIENGFWGRLTNRVMKRPVMFAVPIIILMILLFLPLGKLLFGGISEKYLPPDNAVRTAQEDFDRTFPGFRTNQLTLVIQNASQPQIDEVVDKAARISDFTSPIWRPRGATDEGNHDPAVTVLQNGLVNGNDAAAKISELRSIEPPKGVTLWVGGTPALEHDSIESIVSHLPLMVLMLVSTTTILMFLAFGSLVLPIKAAVMSALTMGSTLGVLTWIFVDGHFSKWLAFTPTPLTAPVIGLIIALIYGLSTDYEVFLVSRMVEARERGMSTAEAIRLGTAATGHIITAAALILVVVGASFVFSDLVMMKYLAFGLVAALLLDATVVRMFLVPSVMKLLGDECWWTPRWMKHIQNRMGLGEIHLPDERKGRPVYQSEKAFAGAGARVSAAPMPPHNFTHEGAGSPRHLSTKGMSTATKTTARNIIDNGAAIARRTSRPAPQGNGPAPGRPGRSPTAAPPRSGPKAETPTATPVPRDPGRGGAGSRTGAGIIGAGDANPRPPTGPRLDTAIATPSRRPHAREDGDEDERQRNSRSISVQELLRREGRI
jgi:trehalose monomycolate/heme transporter